MKRLHIAAIFCFILFGLMACATHKQKPVTKKPPPLLLEPGKYSYTFGVPDEWDFSFDQAHEFGVSIVFFPTGGSFHMSNSVVYAKEICSSFCLGSLSEMIQQTIENARDFSPSLKVSDAESVKIEAGGEAIIRILSGSKDPRQAKEALAFIEHKETIILIVLTTKDTKTWNQDYQVFEEILKGHKFFNCDSPDLAVPCR